MARREFSSALFSREMEETRSIKTLKILLWKQIQVLGNIPPVE